LWSAACAACRWPSAPRFLLGVVQTALIVGVFGEVSGAWQELVISGLLLAAVFRMARLRREKFFLLERQALLRIDWPSLHRTEPIATGTAPVRRAAQHPGVIAVTAIALLWGAYGRTYLIYTVNAGIATALACPGFDRAGGLGREVSLATAGVFGSAVYIYGYFSRPITGKGWPWVLVALFVMLLAAALMASIALISRRLPGIYLVMLTSAPRCSSSAPSSPSATTAAASAAPTTWAVDGEQTPAVLRHRHQ